MEYYRFTIKVAEAQREMALAFMSELPFDTFEETEEGLEAYLPEADYGPRLQAQLDAIIQQLGLSYQREVVPYQNWNAVWEASFEPIQVGQFCGLRATFHPEMPGVQHEIVIDPEMAFGTGHHATTYMMIQAMEQEQMQDAAVFDYGCGTGVLAILAAKMGAAEIDAVDIEDSAFERTQANALRNGAPQLKAYLGDLSVVPKRSYDIILANINRNVILDSLPALYERLEAGGILLVSGILAADQALVEQSAAAQGFKKSGSWRREDWCCLRFSK